MSKTTKPSADGPWQNEPDEQRWIDGDTGLECLMLRGPSGAWCGYVGVPEGHPAHGLSYYKSDYSIEEIETGQAGSLIPIQAQINAISVHGGLTYSGADERRGMNLHWFGFDCAHAGDFSPKFDTFHSLGSPTGWGSVVEYRDVEFVEAECASLARQLSLLAGPEDTSGGPK